MEIDNNRIAPVVTHTGGQGAPVDGQRTGGSGAPAAQSGYANSSSDQLSLTGSARQLQGLENQIASAPVVDTKKVEAVRSAVENGTFTVHPERIAERLLSLEQALTDAR
jgi:negative regulator of flagellin synthesis FlgM